MGRSEGVAVRGCAVASCRSAVEETAPRGAEFCARCWGYVSGRKRESLLRAFSLGRVEYADAVARAARSVSLALVSTGVEPSEPPDATGLRLRRRRKGRSEA